MPPIGDRQGPGGSRSVVDVHRHGVEWESESTCRQAGTAEVERIAVRLFGAPEISAAGQFVLEQRWVMQQIPEEADADVQRWTSAWIVSQAMSLRADERRREGDGLASLDSRTFVPAVMTVALVAAASPEKGNVETG